jgi:hypothetical protein
VSHHHITPPAVYMPAPPKLKETKRKRGVGYSQATGETEETSESDETAAAKSARAAGVPQHQLPVEAAERRIPSPNGKLSDDTLKAMLEAQEQDNAPATASPTAGG